MSNSQTLQIRSHAPTRAQSSIEFLVVFAASTAFFLLLLPQINSARIQSLALATSKAQETALSQLVLAGSEAFSLAPGSTLSGRIFLPAKSTLSYGRGEVRVNNFSKSVPFEATFSSGETEQAAEIQREKGEHYFSASSDGRNVEFRFWQEK